MHERFWADDLIYTASAGRRIGKADILREVHEEGPSKLGDETTVYTAEDIRIQQYGDTASSPSVWWERLTRRGQKRSLII